MTGCFSPDLIREYQIVAALEDVRVHCAEAFRENNIRQSCALIECPRADEGDAVRQSHLCETLAAVEGARPDGGYPVRDLDFLQCGKVHELAIRDHLYSCRPVDLSQVVGQSVHLAAGVEHARGHLGHAVRDKQFLDRAVGKGAAADLPDALLHADAAQLRAAVKACPAIRSRR